MAASFGEGSSVVLLGNGSLVQQTYTLVDPTSGVQLVVRVAAGWEPGTVALLTAFGPLGAGPGGMGIEATLRVGRRRLRSNGTWWTDANGLQLLRRQQRRLNSTVAGDNYTIFEPVAQNFFPATSMAALRDADARGDAARRRARGRRHVRGALRRVRGGGEGT